MSLLHLITVDTETLTDSSYRRFQTEFQKAELNTVERKCWKL